VKQYYVFVKGPEAAPGDLKYLREAAVDGYFTVEVETDGSIRELLKQASEMCNNGDAIGFRERCCDSVELFSHGNISKGLKF
jgi:hypothetical protein